jgi:hypothetical protein
MMVHTVAEMGAVFNWESILSHNICLNIQEDCKGNQPGFCMYSFFNDAICAYVSNPNMGWN